VADFEGNHTGFLERTMPVVVGAVEAVLGIAFLVAPKLLKMPGWSEDLLPDIGIGLLAAGILTMSIEPIARRRLHRDVKEMREAHFESVLKGFMPESIFEEVRTQIIDQPFLRKDFRLTIELSPPGNKPAYLRKTQTISYEVENTSRAPGTFIVAPWVERRNEDQFPNGTKIETVKVTSPYTSRATEHDGTGSEEEYSGQRLEEMCEKTDVAVTAEISVPLGPGQTARVVAVTTSILESRDVFDLLVTTPTTGLDCTVVHPEKFEVQALPLHPSVHAFKVEVHNPTVKRWRIETGLLPSQGIQTTWRPKTAANGELTDTAALIVRTLRALKANEDPVPESRLLDEVNKAREANGYNPIRERILKNSLNKLEKKETIERVSQDGAQLRLKEVAP
jgi:hypothetical protein